MDIKRPVIAVVVAFVLAGPLAACGENTDLERGTTDCGTAEDSADCEDDEDGDDDDGGEDDGGEDD